LYFFWIPAFAGMTKCHNLIDKLSIIVGVTLAVTLDLPRTHVNKNQNCQEVTKVTDKIGT
jgi:hypothetical protein